MRGLSQVSSAMKSISGGNTWCRSCEVRSSWTCSRNWNEAGTERKRRKCGCSTHYRGNRDQIPSGLRDPENDYGLCISSQWEAIIEV